MARSRSIRSFNRGRTNSERGFVLVAALIVAVLYLGLIELLLLDGTRALQEAQRFRARTVAAVLAENAAELAAEQMVNKMGSSVTATDAAGEAKGQYKRMGDTFEITAKATSAGVASSSASVRIQGRIIDGRVKIDYTVHSQ